MYAVLLAFPTDNDCCVSSSHSVAHGFVASSFSLDD
jgi:hypothetical protein